MTSRLVTLDTIDHGPVTVPEPLWCRGHEGEPPCYRADITHNTTVVRAATMTDRHGRVPLLQAYISHAPFADEPHPVVSVVLDCERDFVAEDIPQLVEGLRSVQRLLSWLSVEAKRIREVES